jgi:threonine/homoserine/homoserine lactone efflux protein
VISAVGFAIAMSMTPGPNNIMVASSGAMFGFTRTLPHILGVVLGFTVMFLSVGLGASEALVGHPEVLSILTWVGAAYLIWLAVQMIGSEPALPEKGAVSTGRAGGRQRPMTFIEAALFQWVNPKAWVAVLSAVTTYAVANGKVAIVQVIWLALSFLVFSFVATALWTALGVGVAKFLRTRQRIRLFNIAMAVLLLASLVTLFV